MSLRARLALVLAAVMVGPLVAAWIVIGVLVPHAAATSATTALVRSASATSAYLGQQCLGLGDSAHAVSLALDRTGDRSVDRTAARRAVEEVAARRPGASAFVLVAGSVVADAGPMAGRLAGPDLTAMSRASCARREAPAGSLPALVESVPVLDTAGTEIARSLVVEPLDAAGLATVRDVLGLGTEVALVSSSTASSTTLVSATLPTGSMGQVMSALPARVGGATDGVAGQWRYRVDAAPPGVPYSVVAVSHVDGSRLQLTLLATALVFMAVFGGILLVLTNRLTGPLADLTRVAQRLGRGDLAARSGIRGSDEVGTLAVALDSMAATLQTTVEELQNGRDALAQTFEQFGEALGHTHDLDGLLRTVVEAAKQGAGAQVGTALLGDARGLEERISCAPDGSAGIEVSWVAPAIDAVTVVAEQAVRRVEPVLGEDGVTLAVPLMRGEEVVGALAVARHPGAPPFDTAATAAVSALGAHAGTAVANVLEHQETQRLSVTDPMTGVANFRQLNTTLAREVERAHRFSRPLSILMLDLDHFKQVNDTHGHAFGDAVLREFARRLNGCLREVDLVARYGGEEFAVVLPETGPDGARAVATRIVDAIRREPFTAGEHTRAVTVSAGIASYPDHGRTSADVMRAADAALYTAKRAGRDRWAYADAVTVEHDTVKIVSSSSGAAGREVLDSLAGLRDAAPNGRPQ